MEKRSRKTKLGPKVVYEGQQKRWEDTLGKHKPMTFEEVHELTKPDTLKSEDMSDTYQTGDITDLD